MRLKKNMLFYLQDMMQMKSGVSALMLKTVQSLTVHVAVRFVESLDKTDKEKVLKLEGQRVFKFGGGTCLKSKAEVSIPAVVAGKAVTIKTDVVDSDIPLLLSRTAMKKAAIKLDLEHDTANIMGKKVALNLTTSGHYCIPIDKTVEVPVESVCAVNLDELTSDERNKTFVKLHRQFAHPPKKRLSALLKDAGIWKEEYGAVLDQITDKCELCKVHAKTPSRPVVGMPMATKFNEKVAMDLKQWNGRWILHIIDMWSRYTVSTFVDRKKTLKTNDNIQYRTQDTNEWIHAKILGRAGKASGKNKFWYNIEENMSKEKKSINLEGVQWEMVTHDVNIVAKQTCDDNEVTAAKVCELKKLQHFGTYEEVHDCGQSTLSTRWVITQKNGQAKARLVVRGFEEEYVMQSDSPTVGKGTLRTFLALTASHSWTVKTTDIKSAFLQGKEIRREVYIKPPKESETDTGKIWKLKHGLYGLKDGARQFYLSVKEELISLGCRISEMDPALFVLNTDDKINGIICCHVDDFLHAGDDKFEKIMDSLRKRFVAGKIEEGHFDYIGFRILQESESIILDQTRYVENIENRQIDTKRVKNKEELLTDEEQTLYRKIVGEINWVVQGTRPDLSFEVIDLSTKLKAAAMSDLSRAIKAVNRLKDFRSEIRFPKLSSSIGDWEVIIFTDASLCNINNGTGSTASYVVWLADNEGKCNPIAWHTSKIKRVVRSTIAAEALSLQEGLECAYYYRQMLENIMKISRNSIPIIAYVDNKSVIDAVHSTKLVDDKRLRVDIAAISESLSRNEVKEIRWCPGKYHLADCMTKRGASGYNLLEVLHRGRLSQDFI